MFPSIHSPAPLQDVAGFCVGPGSERHHNVEDSESKILDDQTQRTLSTLFYTTPKRLVDDLGESEGIHQSVPPWTASNAATSDV